MNINIHKTKEMLLGPVLKDPPPLIVIDAGNIDRVTSFKLLGVTITNNLSWGEHVSKRIRQSQQALALFKTVETVSND